MQMPFRFRSPRTVIALVALLGLSSCEMTAATGTWTGDVSAPDGSVDPGYVWPDSGRWAGNVTVHDDTTHQTYSCSTNASITHTDDVVSIDNFDLSCGPDSLHWAPGALTSRGGTIYLGDQAVGQIAGDGTVHMEIDNPYYNAQYPRNADRLDLTWVRVGDSLQLTLTEWYGGVARTMDSSLVRVL